MNVNDEFLMIYHIILYDCPGDSDAGTTPNGWNHKYYGGHTKRSPVNITVPYKDHWHVAIDLGGYTGTVNTSVRIL